jgi:hypothetical protein
MDSRAVAAAAAAAASSGSSGSGWDAWDIAVVSLCCVVATVIGLYPTACKFHEQFYQRRRVKQGKIKQHILATFEQAIPAFADFTPSMRDEIAEQCVEVWKTTTRFGTINLPARTGSGQTYIGKSWSAKRAVRAFVVVCFCLLG